METREGEESANPERIAAAIVLIRGTGIAIAGAIPATTLWLEGNPGWRSSTIPLVAGAAMCLLALGATRVSRRVLWLLVPVVLGWVLVALSPILDLLPPFRGRLDLLAVRQDVRCVAPLPALFLPDLYALWTLLRRRGRMFVARGMLVLGGLSSLLVAWFGSGFLLA